MLHNLCIHVAHTTWFIHVHTLYMLTLNRETHCSRYKWGCTFPMNWGEWPALFVFKADTAFWVPCTLHTCTCIYQLTVFFPFGIRIKIQNWSVGVSMLHGTRVVFCPTLTKGNKWQMIQIYMSYWCFESVLTCSRDFFSRPSFELKCSSCWEIHWASKETYHFFRATLTKIQSH